MKRARQQEHFKQDASPAGDRTSRPPVATGAPGNLHKARRDKTDSLESQTMKNESMQKRKQRFILGKKK